MQILRQKKICPFFRSSVNHLRQTIWSGILCQPMSQISGQNKSYQFSFRQKGIIFEMKEAITTLYILAQQYIGKLYQSTKLSSSIISTEILRPDLPNGTLISPTSGACKVRYTCITLSKGALFSMVFLAIIKQAHSDNILLQQAGQAV